MRAFIFLVCLLISIGSTKADSFIRLVWPCYGTSFQCQVQITPESNRSIIESSLRNILDEQEKIFSSWRPDSEVSQINRLEAHQWMKISDDMSHVFRASQQIFKKSREVFNPAVGTWSQVWKNMRGKMSASSATLPKQVPNFTDIHTNKAGYLKKASHDIALDFGGIAKGYVLDLCSEWLKEQGYDCFLLALGGEILAGKAPKGQTVWKIPLEGPQRKVLNILELESQALSCSGASYQFLEREGRVITHLFDSSSGRSADGKHLAYIKAESSMIADAWATVLMIKGKEGLSIVRQHVAWAGLMGEQGWVITTD